MNGLINSQRCSKYQPLPHGRGFSLIELMVVVAIVGIITSIALPAYTDYVKKGKAAEATATLADLKIKMEQYFQDNRTYIGGACTPTSGDKFFTYACSVAPSLTGYELKATGRSSESMNNFEFSVDQDNLKKSIYDGNSQTGCWLTSKSGTC